MQVPSPTPPLILFRGARGPTITFIDAYLVDRHDGEGSATSLMRWFISVEMDCPMLSHLH